MTKATTTPKGTAKFKIELDEAGRGTVLVDGEDWSHRVYAVTISAKVGELTEVNLHCYGEVAIKEHKGNLTTVENNYIVRHDD